MLVGRENEIAKVRALISSPRARIVTLHGAPGIGKTAIASVIAREVDSVFCDLTNAKTYEEVCFCVASSLGSADFTNALRSRLLVLDGGELAIDAIAILTRELGANARVLVSSRETLRVEHEIAIEIEPLSEEHSRALFIALAGDVHPREETLRALLAAFSGVPLAIMLGASRLAIVTPEELLARIHDRLDFLAANRRDQKREHASLQSAFESSFASLTEDERSALAQCAIFRGPFTLEAAEHVVADVNVADLLQSLAEKSLVRTRRQEERGVRFSMLEIVRRLVSESRAIDLAAHDRHAAWFGKTYARWDETNWYGGVTSLPHLREARDDLLAAHAHSHSFETAIALFPLFATSGPYPALVSLIDEARDEAASPELASRFLLVRGRALQLCAMREEAGKAFEKSLQYARKSASPKLAARALAWIALARRTQGAMIEARERFEAAAALFREVGDSSSEAVVLSGLASLDLAEGDLDAAKRVLETAIDVLIRAGDAATAAMMRVDLGIVLQESADLEGARAVYEAALAAHREAGNQRHVGITLGYLGMLEDEAVRVDRAEVALVEALAIVREIADAKFVAVFASALAAVRAERDDARGAAEALAEAENAARGAEPRIAATVALHALRVHVAAGGGARTIAEKRGAALGLDRQSDDVRFALRMLDRVSSVESNAAKDDQRTGVIVAEDATWIDLPNGKHIDLKRRVVQRRLIEALVRARLASPGVALSLASLIAAGWPAEKLAESSAQNRLHVALATLRADGLRDLLVRESGGYLLDPAIDVRIERQ